MEVAKGNWVGFKTVFYNEISGKFGNNINDVIDFSQFEIHKEGLAAYLDYGYCVFGYTPIKNVKFLLPNQSLVMQDGVLRVIEDTDHTIHLLGNTTKEDDVLDAIYQDVNNWSSTFSGDIMIPTSGGFDSRLLNVVLEDKSRIHTFTYGTSYNQSKSKEVVYARELALRLGTKWKQINLGNFNTYQDEWFYLFGCSVGAVGTYHMEFFNKIKQIDESQQYHLLSGVIGDAWAGAFDVRPIETVEDYRILGHTHQMAADAKRATGVNYDRLVEPIFEKQRSLLKDSRYRILTAMRTKMTLLQSLITIPEYYGFSSYSPFLDEHVAMAMLNISDDRRKNRVWQRDYFRRKAVLFDEETHAYTYQNSLNYYALLHQKVEALDVNLLREVISQDYLEWINKKLSNIGSGERLFQKLMHTPRVKGVMKLMGLKNDLITAYFAYTTLKPIEKLLMKRNQYENKA